jgi:ribosomal protein S12 methylthiotransferase accessory factor
MEITITFPGGLRVDAAAGDLVVRTDQSVANGGEGSAPEPFTLFLASIGTCAGVYALSYCRHHGLPTEGLAVTQRVHRDAMGKRVEHIEIEIRAPAGFPERHLAALARSADLCAVKKAILSPPEFTVRAVAAETDAARAP